MFHHLSNNLSFLAMTYTVRSFNRSVCCNVYKGTKSAAIYRTAVFKQIDKRLRCTWSASYLTSCPIHHYANSCQKKKLAITIHVQVEPTVGGDQAVWPYNVPKSGEVLEIKVKQFFFFKSCSKIDNEWKVVPLFLLNVQIYQHGNGQDNRKVLSVSKTAVYNAKHPSHLSQLYSHFNTPELA